jgi:peptide/nickel transport system substrate-binding protein
MKSKFLVLFAALASAPAWAAPTNKQLTVGTTQEFETLNPTIAQMAASTYIFQMAQRPLTSINADWKWQCYLCVSYPTLENGGAKVVEDGGKKKILVSWEMKPEAKWGDGKPVTGEDFKLAWEIGKDPGVSVGSKETYDLIEKVEVDAKNPKKFTTLIREARYDYNQIAIQVMPSSIEGPIFAKTKGQTGAYEKQTAYTTDPGNPGLYNGPYLLKEIKLGSHAILERNPQWGGAKPAIERVIVKYIPNTQTLEANLQSGTIDLVNEIGMTLDQSLAFEKRIAREPALKQRFKVMYADSLIYEHIDLNLDNPILADVNVRKALVHAIDRDKLTQALFENKQKKAISFIHPKDVHYTEDVVKYDYSPEKAKELLTKAGYKPGAGGVLEKDGKKLSLVIQTTAGNKSRELVEVFIQEQLKKIGVEVTIQNEPARVFFGETMTHRKFPAMAMYAWTSAPDIPHRTELHSAEIPTEKNGWSGQNYPGWKNAQVDEKIAAFFNEFDINKRKALMAAIEKAYTDEVPVIPLYVRTEIVVVPTNLKGYRISGHQYYTTLEIENWSLEATGAH